MANDGHFAKLKEGVEAWNAWRDSEAGVPQPDLSGADLRGATLNLHRATSAAKLSWAKLSGIVAESTLPRAAGPDEPAVDTLPRVAAEPGPDPGTLPRGSEMGGDD